MKRTCPQRWREHIASLSSPDLSPWILSGKATSRFQTQQLTNPNQVSGRNCQCSRSGSIFAAGYGSNSFTRGIWSPYARNFALLPSQTPQASKTTIGGQKHRARCTDHSILLCNKFEYSRQWTTPQKTNRRRSCRMDDF